MVRVEGKNGGAFPLTWTVEYGYEQLASMLLLAQLTGVQGFVQVLHRAKRTVPEVVIKMAANRPTSRSMFRKSQFIKGFSIMISLLRSALSIG